MHFFVFKINTRGMSLIEVMVAGIIGAIVLGGGGYSLSQAYKHYRQSTKTIQVESQLYGLMTEMEQSGRLAQRCIKEPPPVAPDPPAVALRCVIDSGGGAKYVRYKKILSDSFITVEVSSDPVTIVDPTVWHWSVLTQYGNTNSFKISGFDICDHTEMSGGTCALLPAELNTFYSGACNPGDGIPNQHCFRIYLKADDPVGLRRYEFQTAFYTRAPAPAGLSYVWNGQ